MKHIKVSIIKCWGWGSHVASVSVSGQPGQWTDVERHAQGACLTLLFHFWAALKALVPFIMKPKLFGWVHKMLHNLLSSDPCSDHTHTHLQHKGRAVRRHMGKWPGSSFSALSIWLWFLTDFTYQSNICRWFKRSRNAKGSYNKKQQYFPATPPHPQPIIHSS